MNRELRLSIFEQELRRLLQSDVENDYVVFSDLRDDRHYVQFLRHDDAIYGEVGAPRPEAKTALGCLGFSGSGSTFSRERLPQDARKLACLAELLFGAAYGSVEDLTIIVMTRASPRLRGEVRVGGSA